LGLEPCERRLGRMDVMSADEAFLTGTGVGIVAVRALDGRQVGAGCRGPVTERIMEAFRGTWARLGTPLWPDEAARSASVA
jgi:branched-chain amino acid aminotransferase